MERENSKVEDPKKELTRKERAILTLLITEYHKCNSDSSDPDIIGETLILAMETNPKIVNIMEKYVENDVDNDTLHYKGTIQ